MIFAAMFQYGKNHMYTVWFLRLCFNIVRIKCIPYDIFHVVSSWAPQNDMTVYNFILSWKFEDNKYHEHRVSSSFSGKFYSHPCELIFIHAFIVQSWTVVLLCNLCNTAQLITKQKWKTNEWIFVDINTNIRISVVFHLMRYAKMLGSVSHQ